MTEKQREGEAAIEELWKMFTDAFPADDALPASNVFQMQEEPEVQTKRTYNIMEDNIMEAYEGAIKKLLEKGILNLTEQELDRLGRLDALQCDVNKLLLTFAITC